MAYVLKLRRCVVAASVLVALTLPASAVAHHYLYPLESVGFGYVEYTQGNPTFVGKVIAGTHCIRHRVVHVYNLDTGAEVGSGRTDRRGRYAIQVNAAAAAFYRASVDTRVRKRPHHVHICAGGDSEINSYP